MSREDAAARRQAKQEAQEALVPEKVVAPPERVHVGSEATTDANARVIVIEVYIDESGSSMSTVASAPGGDTWTIPTQDLTPIPSTVERKR